MLSKEFAFERNHTPLEGGKLLNCYDNPVYRIMSVFRFQNNLRAVFCGRGHQIPELQNEKEETIQRVIRLSDKDTEWFGFDEVPEGAKGKIGV